MPEAVVSVPEAVVTGKRVNQLVFISTNPSLKLNSKVLTVA
jgi:hypothetical protein